MRVAPRTFLALASLVPLVGSCVGSDSPTDTGSGAAVGVAFQPALIPTPADADALPVNRVHVSVSRVSDGLLVGQTAIDVNPSDTAWVVDVTVPEPYSAATVHVFVRLINVVGDGTEAVQFSGRSDPVTLVPGEQVTPDVPIVRGPVANLFTTGVSITSAPATMAVGATATFTADATTSGTVAPTVFWTSLAPDVVSMSGATATAVAGGTADVVASAGAFADTVSVQVYPALAVTTTSLPDATQDTPYGQTLTATGGDGSYTWSVAAGALPAGITLDAGSGVILGTPTAVESASFTVQVASGDGQAATRALSISVARGALRWASAASGDWGVAANWSPARVPQAGDSVVIDVAGTYTVTLDQVTTLSSLAIGGATGAQTLAFNGFDLTADAGVSVGANGVLDLAGTLSGAGAVTTLGQIVLDGTLDATLDNQGALTVLGLSTLAATGHTSSGTMDLTSGTLTIIGDLATSGTVAVGAGEQLTFEFGSLTYDGGPWSGDGEIRFLEGAQGLLNADLDLAGLDLTLSTGELTGAGTLTVPSNSAVGVFGAGIGTPITNDGSIYVSPGSLGGDVDHRGTMLLEYTVTLGGTVTTDPASTITVRGNGGASTTVTLTDSGFTNNGTLELTSVAGSQDVTLAVSNGSLVNASAGAISVLTGGGQGTRTIDAALVDRGAMTLDHDLVVTGPLTVLSSDAVTVGSGNGSRLQVSGLDVDGLTLDGAPLTSTGGTILGFDNVTFQGMDPTLAQLVVAHPGATSPFTFASLTFAATPTTGFYVVANDTDTGDGNVLTLNLTNANPTDGSALESEINGAMIHWGGAPPAGNLARWADPVTDVWSNPARWDPASVPIPGDSVVVDVSGSYQITLDQNAQVAYLLLGTPPQLQWLILDGGDTLTVDSAAVINPNGLIDLQDGTLAGPGTYSSAGTLQKTGPIPSAVAAYFENDGIVIVGTGAELELQQATIHEGDFSINDGGVLRVIDSDTLAMRGDVFGAGVLEVDATGTDRVTVDGDVDVGAIRLLGGTLWLDNAVAIADSIRVVSGSLGARLNDTIQIPYFFSELNSASCCSRIRIEVTDSMHITGGFFHMGVGGFLRTQPGVPAVFAPGFGPRFQTDVQLQGPSAWTGGNILLQSGAAFELLFGATLAISGNRLFTTSAGGGTVLVGAGATLTGQPSWGVTVRHPFQNDGLIEMRGGQLRPENGFTHSAGGVIQGYGTLELRFNSGGLTMDGDLVVGDSIGVFTTQGSLAQGGPATWQLELGGTAPGAGYDQIFVSDTVTLAGSLVVDTVGGFVPADGDRFAVMVFGERVGNFTNVTLPSVAGLTLDTVWAEVGTTDTLFVVAVGSGPTSLALGDVVSATISTSGEIDEYTFDGASGDIVSLALGESGFSVFATIYDPLDVQVSTINPVGAAQNDFTLGQTGTYRIEVRAADMVSTGDYYLGLEGISPVSSDASAMVLGDVVSSDVTGTVEVDEYTFDASTGDVVTLALVESGTSMFARVLTPSGTLLTTINPLGGIQSTLTLGEDGTYLIQVRALDLLSTGTYDLGLEGIAPATPTPTALVLGDVAMGTLGEVAGADLYSFDATAGDIVSISVGEAGLNAFARIFDPAGTEIGTINPLGAAQSDFTLGSTGTHLIMIRAVDVIDTGDYYLGLEGISPATGSATPLTVGDSLQVTIAGIAEVDAYTFDATSGADVTFGLVQLSGFGGGAVRMVVYAPSGVLLQTILANSEQQFTPTEDGTHTILVFSTSLLGTGDYEIRFVD